MADLQKVKGVMVETGFAVTPEDRADWTGYITGSSMIEAADSGAMKPPSFYYALNRRTYWENHKDSIAGIPNAASGAWSAMITIIPYYKAADDALTQVSYSKSGTFTRVSVGTNEATATWGAWQKYSTIGYTAVPASATSTGVAGSYAADANYLYVCYATNLWKRTALATW